MKVFLDPGHGGKDPGAVGNGLQEKDIILPVTLKTGAILKQHGLNVLYSRTTDIFVGLSERARMANAAKANIFVSLHCNAATNIGARGVETYNYPGSVQGAKLARAVQDSLVQSKIFSHNRGVKVANFAVLRESIMPAALVELGFISNAQDAQILKGCQADMAQAVAKGILSYLGLAVNKGGVAEGGTKEQPSAWAKDAWEWAKRKGYFDGTRPQDNITREELAVIIQRLVDKK